MTDIDINQAIDLAHSLGEIYPQEEVREAFRVLRSMSDIAIRAQILCRLARIERHLDIGGNDA